MIQVHQSWTCGEEKDFVDYFLISAVTIVNFAYDSVSR